MRLKRKKYPELTLLKGKIREKKLSYKVLAEIINISTVTFNNKINGYSDFDTTEISKISEQLDILPNEIPKYFFPQMIRNAL